MYEKCLPNESIPTRKIRAFPWKSVIQWILEAEQALPSC